MALSGKPPRSPGQGHGFEPPAITGAVVCSESAASSRRLAEKQSEYRRRPQKGRDRALTSWRDPRRGRRPAPSQGAGQADQGDGGVLRPLGSRPGGCARGPHVPEEAGPQRLRLRPEGPSKTWPEGRGRAGRKLLRWALRSPRACLLPRPGLPGKQLHSWVPPGALLRWEAGPTVVGPCCCG